MIDLGELLLNFKLCLHFFYNLLLLNLKLQELIVQHALHLISQKLFFLSIRTLRILINNRFQKQGFTVFFVIEHVVFAIGIEKAIIAVLQIKDLLLNR